MKDIEFIGYMKANTQIHITKPKDGKKYVKILVRLESENTDENKYIIPNPACMCDCLPCRKDGDCNRCELDKYGYEKNLLCREGALPGDGMSFQMDKQ